MIGQRINFPGSILLGTLFLLTACGVKGNLQPKGAPEPMAVSAITLKQQGEEILLSWQAPAGNQDGSALSDLAGFHIDLYTYPPDRYCPECRDQETVASIEADTPGPAVRQGSTYFYRTGRLDQGSGYRYRIRPLTDRGRIGPHTEARHILLPPPAAPIDIRVEEQDRGVRLFWRLPDTVQKAGDLIGVNLYRGNPDGTLNPVPLNPEPVAGNNFADFGLENGITYRYGLRTVIRTGQVEIESEPGEIVTATPQAGL